MAEQMVVVVGRGRVEHVEGRRGRRGGRRTRRRRGGVLTGVGLVKLMLMLMGVRMLNRVHVRPVRLMLLWLLMNILGWWLSDAGRGRNHHVRRVIVGRRDGSSNRGVVGRRVVLMLGLTSRVG